MQAKITNSLISKLEPGEKPFEVNDTELMNFCLRVQPSGVMSFVVKYRWEGKLSRKTLGRTPPLKAPAARKEAERILSGIRLGKSPLANEKGIKQTLREYIDEDKGDYGRHLIATQKNGKRTIRRIKSRFSEFLDRPIREIKHWELEKFRSKRVADGVTAQTINRDFDDIKALFTKALKWKDITENPTDGLQKLKTDRNPRVRYLSSEEEERLRKSIDEREEGLRLARESYNRWCIERGYQPLPSLKDVPFCDHIKPMILVSINTGIRRGELFNLKIEDVELGNNNLSVKGSNSKSGHTKHVPLNKEATEVLEKWISMLKRKSCDDLVFPNKNNEPFNDIKKAFKGLLSRAGIENFRFHDLRHTFASKLVMKGVDLNTVRELLGHSDIKMTLRYAHLAPKHKADAVSKLLE